MSLKLKISLLVSGLLFIAVGGLTGILLWNEERALVAETRDTQLKMAEGLAEVCRDAVINQQFLPLTNYLRRLKESPGTSEAMCLDTRGEVIGHTDANRIRAVLSDEKTIKTLG